MNMGNLKYQYARLSIAEKLIAINVLIFLVNGLLVFLLRLPGNFVERWFELPTDFFDFLKQPWSLVTYSFFHGGLWHILFNMIMLYFSGRIFLNLFGNRRFVNVYFLGVIAGGLSFLLSYNIFPAFLDANTALIGASAGVTAVLIFVCAYIPNQEVRLLFFNIKLWYIGVFLVLIDLVQIPIGNNAGGHLAHLGGALLGYTYASQLINGKDIGEWFSLLLDAVANLFKRNEKRAPLKTVYRKKRDAGPSKNYDKDTHQRKIDDILDKISKSGYESLSKAEKDFLFKAGKND
ncbi:rhomboid family intramembrane serine protease [Flavobacteriaceae bacterium F89]|uniref:Rhomboid family intramembrane serine protease n=1 Tax=Cerina litoralis TaxID=2874477 RepID=A0AAE3ER56_9FLAO|nr:rhomboid family intramembrane serine protease [Cerina litoralis]MCG2459597.1 rhomboid family intramembrane serine protease [Cerina litoralis]